MSVQSSKVLFLLTESAFSFRSLCRCCGQKKPQNPILLSHFTSGVNVLHTLAVLNHSSFKAVRCYYGSVLPEVFLVGTQLCCLLHHVLTGTYFHSSRAREQNIFTGSLMLDENVNRNVATRLLNCDISLYV